MDVTQREMNPGSLSRVKKNEQTEKSSRTYETQSEKSHSAEPHQKEEEDASGSFIDYEQLMVLFIAGWVISLTLAKNDDSKCLDELIMGFDYNFRHWLWINFGISVSIMFLCIIGTVIDLASRKSFFTEALQAITIFVILIGGIFKVAWIFIGVTIFLSQLDFSKCSSTIIIYCSAQFLVFLTAFSFVIIKKVIKKFITFPKRKPKKKADSKGQKSSGQKRDKKDANQPEQSGQSKLQKFIQQSASRQKKQLAFWGTIGWIYAFAMARKESSVCLDENYDTVSITFREWFYIDGATTLFSFAVFVVLAFKMETEVTKNKRKLFDRLIKSVDWMKNYCILGTLLLLSVLFKMCWVLVGMFMFFLDMNIGENYCKGLVVDYLILYFVEFVYLIVIFLIIMVYGVKRGVIVLLKKKNNANPNENVKEEQVKRTNIQTKQIMPGNTDQSLLVQEKLITKQYLDPLNNSRVSLGLKQEPIKTPEKPNQPQKPIEIMSSAYLEQPIITNIEQDTSSPKKRQVLNDQEAIDIIRRIPYGNSKREIQSVNILWSLFDVNQNEILSLSQTIQGCKHNLQLPLYFDAHKFAIVRAFHGSKNKVKHKNQEQDYLKRNSFHYFLRYLRIYYECWIAFRRINPKFDRKIILKDFIQVIPSLEQLGLKVQKPADKFKKLADKKFSDKKVQLEFDNFIKWAVQQILKKLEQ